MFVLLRLNIVIDSFRLLNVKNCALEQGFHPLMIGEDTDLIDASRTDEHLQ